jgi:hypothetical protein
MVLIFLSIACIPANVIARTQARATAPAGAVEACNLLKKEDAAAALGGAVTGPKATGPLNSAGSTITGCGYSGSGLLSIQLNVTRLPADQVAIFKGTCAKAGQEGLAGLGEVACWYNSKHEELHVFKRAVFVSIELRGKSNPTDAIKAAAKKVVDQLK